jgi:Putative zinc-finger
VTEMTHEHCSALLRSLEVGDLSASQARAVEAHLASCAECSRERAGMRWLLEMPAEGLSDDERRQLHTAIEASFEREKERRREPVLPLAPRRQLWPALRVAAAAAVIVAGFVFATTVLRGGDEDAAVRQEASGTAGGAGTEAAPAETQPGPVFAGTSHRQAASTEQTEDAAVDQAGGARQALKVAAPEPPFSEGELRELGATGRPFTDFAITYSAADADRLAEPFLARLADAAPNEDVAAEVRTCGEVMLGATTTPVLPAFAAIDDGGNQSSLIVGVVESETGTGRLDHYLLWTWDRGDCDHPIHSITGEIRTRG